MKKAINIIVVFFALLSLVQAQEQTSNSLSYRKSTFEAILTYGNLSNKLAEESYYGIKGTGKQVKDGLFFGGEIFLTKTEFTSSQPRINNNGKTIVGGFGSLGGFLKLTPTIVYDARLNIGLSHISQTSYLIHLGLFDSFKYVQTQNDWLWYSEPSFEMNQNTGIFSRLFFGLRYEQPFHSTAKASVNGMEVRVRTADRKNIQTSLEVGVMKFNFNTWALTTSVQGGYRHFFGPKVDLYQIGAFLTLNNSRGPVVWLGYSQDLNTPGNSTETKNIGLRIDILNFNAGL